MFFLNSNIEDSFFPLIIIINNLFLPINVVLLVLAIITDIRIGYSNPVLSAFIYLLLLGLIVFLLILPTPTPI